MLYTHKLDKLGMLLSQSSYDVLLLKTFVGDLFCRLFAMAMALA
jgi:hypothetical protein